VAAIAIDERQSHNHAARLYEEHTEWLLRYCTRQLGGLTDAEDAIQTTFLYAFRALRRGVVPECERAWLTTIARNVCHSQRRAEKRSPDTVELDVERIALAQPDVQEVGFMEDVRTALAALPDNQRRALVLREWQGASSDEIATELQLSEPATHALLFRARKSFATAMSTSRSALAGLNVAVVIDFLRTHAKPLLGGAATKAAVVTSAAGVVIGGVVLEERTDRGAPSPPATPPATVAVKPDAAFLPLEHSNVPLREMKPRVGNRRPQAAAAARVARGSATTATVAVPDADRPVPVVAPEQPTAPPPWSAEAPPGVPAPTPVPPIDPPVPAPIDPPPILGEYPPVELPPPVDEVLPAVEPPALDPPPLP
jgi:RNA polymerase sigma factor (sigma-70 family)